MTHALPAAPAPPPRRQLFVGTAIASAASLMLVGGNGAITSSSANPRRQITLAVRLLTKQLHAIALCKQVRWHVPSQI